MLYECTAFFSSADVFDFSEEFLIHGYAYVMLHVVDLLRLVYLIYRKALLALPHKNKPRPNMKTLRISDEAHQKLTGMLGEITAQTMKMQTYTDAIENLLSQSVTMPAELLNETQTFIQTNKQLGYTTREEFIRDAIRDRLRFLKNQIEYLEISKEEYETLQQALTDMDTPFKSVEDFMNHQIRGLLEKYAEWGKQKETYEKR